MSSTLKLTPWKGLLAAGLAVGAAALYAATQLTFKGRRVSLMERIAISLATTRTKVIKRHRPKRIILIRHGQSEGNVDETVYQRKADHMLELTGLGQEQALEAGKKLRELVGDEDLYFFVSPFLRARQTCAGILKGGKWADMDPAMDTNPVHPTPSVTVKVDPRLREQEWGNVQNPTDMAKAKKVREQVGRFFYRFPDGESGADVYDRMSGFCATLFRQMDNFSRVKRQNYVIVCHGLSARLLLMRFFRWSVSFFESVWNLKNCEQVVLEKNSKDAYELVTDLRVGRGPSTRPALTRPLRSVDGVEDADSAEEEEEES